MWLERLMAQVERYLNEPCALEEVDTWVTVHLQAILDSGDPKAIDMANAVDADLIEAGEGIIDDAVLYERFKRYLAASAYGIRADSGMTHVVTDPQSHVISQETIPWSEVLIRLPVG